VHELSIALEIVDVAAAAAQRAGAAAKSSGRSEKGNS